MANTAGTGPRDPRSVDRRKSARVAERAKDVAREKAEVERVSLEWLAEELAGGREESHWRREACVLREAGEERVFRKNLAAEREEQAGKLQRSREESTGRKKKTAPTAAKQVCCRRRGVECDGLESIREL